MLILLIGFISISVVSASNETVSDLQNTISETSDNGIVTLDHDYTFNENDNEINIDKPITIEGNNHVIDGNGHARIMKITVPAIIKNIVFKNGNSTYGGAIDAKNALIQNCTFINNHAEFGGAIIAEDCKINYCIFTQNTADTGGAIFSQSSTIYSSTFTNNNAAAHGGAVYCENSKITNSIFKKNSADFGGAVTSFSCKIYSSEFYSNIANNEGGALYAFKSTIKKDIFNNNKAKRGGAIYCSGNTIEKCTFKNKKLDTVYPNNNDLIKLTLNKVKIKKSAKKLVLKAKLKINGIIGKNKIVKFKFNKKTYKAKTNSKGVAKITINKKTLKKLKAGKKIKYKVIYETKGISKTVKVKQ